MRLLVTGSSGLYGSKLAALATERKYQVYSGYKRDQPASGIPLHFDVSDKNQVEETFRKVNPEFVVHAAALTDVDRCELNKKLAWKINVEGTRNIAEAVNTRRAFLIYVSTDYVFNGETGMYKENDEPEPINYYGLTKLESEELVKNLVNEYCIVRPSVIYGSTIAAGKINFALWVLNNLRSGKQVRIVTNQWNSPTLNTSLAEMTLEIARRKLQGIFHLSGATRISRYDFAKFIAHVFNVDANLLSPSTIAEFSWTAKRPKDSSLDTTKAQQTLKNKPLQISQALERMKKELVYMT